MCDSCSWHLPHECEPGVVDGQHDDVQEDAEQVDGQAEEDRLLAGWQAQAPQQAEQQSTVVDQQRLGRGEHYSRLKDKKNPGLVRNLSNANSIH